MQLIASPACIRPEKTESPLVLLFIKAITLELRVVEPDRAEAVTCPRQPAASS